MSGAAIERWSLGKKLLFSLLPGVVLFSGIEVVLRACGVPREKYLIQRFAFPPAELLGVALLPDPARFWRLAPGYDGPWTLRKLAFTHELKSHAEIDRAAREASYRDREYGERVTWQIDASGLRGAAPAPGRRLLLFVGSSVTFGWGVRAEDGFAGLLRRRLVDAGHTGWDAIDAGVPGYTSHQALVYLEQLLRRYRIGAIVFETGINDGTWAPVRSDREYALLARPPRFGNALQHSSLYLWLHYALAGRDARLASVSPLVTPFFASSSYRPGHSRVSASEFVENLAAARRLARKHGARIYFVFPALYDEDGSGGVSKSVDHSEPEEIDVTAALASLDAVTLADQFLPWDEAHLSPRGHRLLADLVWARLDRDAVFAPPVGER